jgi:hypothetical protein
MKKTTIKLLSILTITLFTFSSCTKDRTCECTYTVSNSLDGSVDEDNSEIEYEKVTKKWMKNSANCVSSTETEDYIDYDYFQDNFGNPITIETPYTITRESDCEIN